MRAAVDPYARAWNSAFAASIPRHLPREVRDMVYEELVCTKRKTSRPSQERRVSSPPGDEDEEPTLTEIRRPGTAKKIRFAKCRSFLKPLKTAKDFPHYYDQDYMGIEFAYELVQVVYKTHTFCLQHQADLPPFLTNDIFGTECDPSARIKSLQITISLDRFNPKIDREYT
jgi:hypothetical protein